MVKHHYSKIIVKGFLGLCGSFLLGGCAYHSSLEVPITEESLPAVWNQGVSATPVSGWLDDYSDPVSQSLVQQALQRNYALLISSYQMRQAQTRVDSADAQRWPEVGMSVDANRGKSVVSGTEMINNNFGLAATISWEADLWGKLSARSQSAMASYLATRADYEAMRLSVSANVLKSWFQVISARQLLDLFQQRLQNLKVNQEVIEVGFQQGINDALDVYLVRSDVNSEIARVAEQRQALADAKRDLQVLIGDFPDGEVASVADLPAVGRSIPVGVPADLLQRRYDIQAAWMGLRAADANLAVAHRNRFPSFSLTGSLGKSSEKFSQLLDGPLQWNLGASLLQVIFDEGYLKSLEQEAKFALLEQEQQYNQVVFNAFREVASYIDNEAAIREQMSAYQLAKDNALAAEQQAFEQYRKGLVAYTTVLESQRRAFDTQTSVIQLQLQQLVNRINLHVALGGGFEEQISPKDQNE